MLPAISICFLLGVVSVVSSQTSPPDYTSDLTEQVPTAERRSLGHIKPIKRTPLIKKHKKFGPWKTEFAAVPIYQAPHPPLYKIHRFPGAHFKPAEDSTLSLAPLEFYPESHVYSPQFTAYFLSSPPKHTFHSFSPSFPIKTPIPSVSPPVIVPTFPPSPPLTFFKHPESSHKIEPIFHSVPLPPPHSFPVASFPLAQPFILPPIRFSPSLISPTSPPLFHSTVALPQISTPAPILHSFPEKDSFPPSFSFETHTSTSDIAPPAPDFSSPTTPEPEFPYPPSDTPIFSHIKDTSLTDPHPEVPESAPEVSVIEKDTTKFAAPALSPSQPDAGLLKKFKGWKTQTASAALNHLNKLNKFQNFNAPAAHSTVSDKTPLTTNLGSSFLSSHLPVLPSVPFHAPSPSDLKPFQGFFSLPHQNPLPPIKYEHFPPNSQPTLFNSYGVPIPHDSYAPPRHSSHDRVSPAASEEKASVLPPPPNFTEETPKPFSLNSEQIQGTEQPQTSQSPLEFQTKNYRQFKPSSEVIFKERPVYVSDNKETSEEGDKQTEQVSQLQHNTNFESSTNDGKHEQVLGSHSNHREE